MTKNDFLTSLIAFAAVCAFLIFGLKMGWELL